METDIITDQDRLETLIAQISKNTQELLSQKIPSRTLVQNAIPRGLRVIKGNIDTQTVVDLCAIALTVLVQEFPSGSKTL